MRKTRPTNPTERTSRPAGSVVMIVMWAIAVAALICSSVQLFAYRQATLGHEALNRAQARWAARAGIESTIAMMALHTEQPIPDDAFALMRDLAFVHEGGLFDAVYDIKHHVDGRDYAGPLDEHSRLNLNAADASSLAILEDITPDVVAAITDWIDEDDEAGLLGAEGDYYLSMTTPYAPRNGSLRHVAEMELIAGIWAEFVRGEDWNLNNRKDPNEDDGMQSSPDDEPDGYLEGGWAQLLTVQSVEGGATESGLTRLHLRWAEEWEVEQRVPELTEEQATILINFAKVEDNYLEQLLIVPITRIESSGQISNQEVNPDIDPLTDEQIRTVIAEMSVRPLFERRPGRININTASPEFIRDLLLARNVPDVIAEEIIYLRDSRIEGLTSLLSLREIPDLTDDLMDMLVQTFTTTSNVFTITSRGQSLTSSMEVEIITVVDRSSVPVRIIEYREQ